MTIELRRLQRPMLAISLALGLLAGCGGGSDGDAGTGAPPPVGTPGDPAPLPPTPPSPVPETPAPESPDSAPTAPSAPSQQPEVTPTEVGEVQGAEASAEIGPEGGTLTSNDGRLTLTIPAGAFDAVRQVSIVPISNKAHGAKGPAYRLSPEGLNTPVPMTLTFEVDATSLRGTALPLMTIATQDANRRWHAYLSPVRDIAASTISVQTHHFSDWALITGVQLQPTSAVVAVKQSLDLFVIKCPTVEDPDSDDTAWMGSCDPDVLLPGQASNWAVNGEAGGSSISGTIVPGKTSSLEDAPWATFYAPAAVPSVNPVAVSVDYREHTPDAPHLKLVSNVTIVPKPDCSWLHSVQTLYYEMEMQYSFSGAGPRGMLTLDQYGLILGEMTQQFDGEPYGVWRGYSTRGHATVSDQHTYGSLISVLYGSGTPDIGEDVDYSVATLVVDYQTCTYTVTGQVAVLASAGGREPPSVRNIAAFTRGNLPIDLDTGLIGREYMPPRLQADPAGTYFPGGLGIGMVADGYATEENAGKAMVRWSVWP